MDDKVIELEEYRNALNNKKDLDNGNITVDDLSLEELEDVNKLYKSEIYKLDKHIELLKEENKLLRIRFGKE